MSLPGGHHLWSSSTGSITTPWNSYETANAPSENGMPSSSGYHYDTQRGMPETVDVHNGNSASLPSTSSSLGTTNVTQEYSSYAAYATPSQAYLYNNTEHQHYYHYQQPAGSSTSQQDGAQHSGAPHPSFSSFQHAGSYVAPTNHSSTYYNTGDQQTAAGYPSNSYVNQPNYWNDGSTGNLSQNQYSSYTTPVSDSNQVTSNTAASSLPYQQYSPWPYHYYYPPAPPANCPPGTENVLATNATSASSVQVPSGGYSYTTIQPPPPGTTPWRKEPDSSVNTFLQDKNYVVGYSGNGSSELAVLTSQSHQGSPMPPQLQKPTSLSSLYPEKCEGLQMAAPTQSQALQAASTHQVLENFRAPASTPILDSTRWVSKMQIPTNPRITSNLAFAMSKPDKETSTANAAMKPSFTSVQVPKPSHKLPGHDDADSMMKGTLPASLRTYVERTFARCKDDSQRAANQKLMKEMIAKASADGSLFTKNWDIEPLFALPNSISDHANQNEQNSFSVSTLPKFKRSPNRRTKSRWEPIADEKLVEKPATSTNYDLTKSAEKSVVSRIGSNNNSWSGIKFVPAQQQTPKTVHRPGKKPRIADATNVNENGDASSDSDKEQGLTKYYASAIALANSPEEKKRREHRFKRFEKGQENKTETRFYKPKVSGTGNTYTRKASAMLLAKNSEASCSRAVEDIDWDALTVKGTCQEVEKRYLRLTSAPDPATVRPEEVLEKALHMVQTSQRNYLYKCDQLKSIRQDLTVQRIHNELTVKVYETHARFALEAGDLPEYNQCQSQLKSLYAEGIKGCHFEFAAYNLLCIILHSNNKRDLLSAMARLSIQAKQDAAVKHALAVSSAVSSGNYVQFFRLYKTAPNMNTSLMDLFVEKMRFNAIKCICKSYRPTLPVSYIAPTLGFSREEQTAPVEDNNVSGTVECEEWLKAHGALVATDSSGEVQVDTKASTSSLFMPEPDDAVTHGDATLAVDDFLTRAVS